MLNKAKYWSFFRFCRIKSRVVLNILSRSFTCLVLKKNNTIYGINNFLLKLLSFVLILYYFLSCNSSWEKAGCKALNSAWSVITECVAMPWNGTSAMISMRSLENMTINYCSQAFIFYPEFSKSQPWNAGLQGNADRQRQKP